jgi:DNA repair exonuclease SbcCD nuclease subunit
MRIAHLSDLHLGYSAFGAVDRGRNTRSLDVEEAFHRAAQAVVSLAPDLVLVAGDVVDHAEPDAQALLGLTEGIQILREGLPEIPVIAVAGGRDAPVRRDSAGILPILDTLPGVEGVYGIPRGILLPGLDLHVLAVPHRALSSSPFPTLRPRPSVRWNVLLAHAAWGGSDGPELELEKWNYVALGHEHTHREAGPRTWYSGSLERVTADPWAEAADEKGFLLADLQSGEVEFHPVPGRPVVELAPVRLRPGEEAEISRKILDAVEVVPGGIEDKLVRLPIFGLTPEAVERLDPQLMAELRDRALHLRVDVEEAETADPPIRLVDGADLDRAIEGAADVAEASGSVSETLSSLLGEIRRVSDSEALTHQHRPHPVPGVFGQVEPLAFNRRGAPEPAAPSVLLDEAAAVLARAAGMDHLEILRLLLTTGTVDPEREVARAALGEFRALASRIREVEASIDALDGMEEELRDLRADSIVVAGDLQAATADWLRERQDAETSLRTYRDQALQLKARIEKIEAGGAEAACPTCQRPLGDRVEEVVSELQEELESLVQDGKWWKGRREQLEEKPQSIREQESEEVRLGAAMEAVSDRIQEARVGARDLDDLKQRARYREQRLEEMGVDPDKDLPAPDGSISVPTGFEPGTRDAELAISVVRAAEAALTADARREVLAGASQILNRISCGTILALDRQAREPRLLREPPPDDSRPWLEFLVGLALRIALVDALGDGSRVAAVTIDHRVDLLPPELRALVLQEAQRLAEEGVRVRVRSHGNVVDHHPEAFDAAVEDGVSGSGKADLHVGSASLRPRESSRRTRGRTRTTAGGEGRRS